MCNTVDPRRLTTEKLIALPLPLKTEEVQDLLSTRMSMLEHPLIMALRNDHSSLARLWDCNYPEELVTFDKEVPVEENSERYFHLRFRKDLLRKSNLDLGVDTERAALDLFFETEAENINRNLLWERLRGDFNNPSLSEKRLIKILKEARWAIATMLRSFDPNKIEGYFTSGATPDFPRGAFPVDYLYTTAPRQKSIVDYISANEILEVQDPWIRSGCTDGPHVDFCVAKTVPKTWKTKRFIAEFYRSVMFWQRGLGVALSKALGDWGYTLNHAAKLHAEIALESSIMGTHSCIDLTTASDTVVKEALWLFPKPVREAIIAFRTPDIQVEKEGEVITHQLQMLAPAGAGFTFEFETIMFMGLMIGVALEKGLYSRSDFRRYNHNVSVFGDDILVVNSLGDDAVSVLKALGFIPNLSKSFLKGHRCESCGTDAYNGVSIKGVTIDGLPSTPREWYSVANGIYRVCYIDNGRTWRHSYYSRLHRRILECIPEDQRWFGPEYYGDAVLHSHAFWDEPKLSRHKSGGYSIRTLQPVEQRREKFATRSQSSKGKRRNAATALLAALTPNHKGHGPHRSSVVTELRYKRREAFPPTEETWTKWRDLAERRLYTVPALTNRDDKSYATRDIAYGTCPTPFEEGNLDDTFKKLAPKVWSMQMQFPSRDALTLFEKNKRINKMLLLVGERDDGNEVSTSRRKRNILYFLKEVLKLKEKEQRLLKKQHKIALDAVSPDYDLS